jgi:hypothetical protein
MGLKERLATVLVVALAVWVLVQAVTSAGSSVAAADPEAPIMVINDERDAGAKEAEPTIYVLWPGQRRVEAYCSRTCTYVAFDFPTRKVISRPADLDFQ